MDFFSHQEAALRRTLILLALLPLAVALLIGATVVLYQILMVMSFNWVLVETPQDPFTPERYHLVEGVTLALVMVGSGVRVWQLAQGGGGRIAREMGGRRLTLGESPEERRLLNVVEEMAIAAGLPVPEVYVLDQQEGINAFAAGLSPQRAAIVVTAGSVRLLTRNELQGVVAHEFSHILHGDMRLNLVLIGVLHGIQMFAVLGRNLAERAVSVTKPSLNPLAVILGYLLWIAGYVGLVLARLIKGAISRQREYLADAAAVQFTRNPHGLAGALLKIGGFSLRSTVIHPKAEEASHLFFGDGMFRRNFFDWTASHPPLEERIRRLLPGVEFEFPKLYGNEWYGLPAELTELVVPLAEGSSPLTAREVVATVGAPQPAHLEYATRLRAGLPVELDRRLATPGGAAGVVAGLLISHGAAVVEEQLRIVTRRLGEPEAATAAVVAAWLASRGDGSVWRLPLLDLALPALRGQPPEWTAGVIHTMELLIRSEPVVQLFDFVLYQSLRRQLRPESFVATSPTRWLHSFRKVSVECGQLLSTLAHAGAADSARARDGFAAGIGKLGLSSPPPLLPVAECQLARLEPALERLQQLSPNFKKLLIEACGACVTSDGVITPTEGELLRVICDLLDCPVPPLFPGTC